MIVSEGILTVTIDVKKELYESGYFHIINAKKLPQGVSLWVKPEGDWWEYPQHQEYLCAFVHDIEGQGITYGLSFSYFRAHRNKNVKSYLENKSVDMLKNLKVEEVQGWKEKAKQTLIKSSLDRSPKLRV